MTIRQLLIWGIPVLALVSLASPPAPFVATPSVVSLSITDRAGSLLYEARPDGRSAAVRLDDIPPHVVDAVLAIEDTRFRRHPGIDLVAIGRAIRDNVRSGRIVSGASTLTMQVARMRRASGSRGVIQKLAEMQLAVRLEIWQSKREILVEWLTRAYFGRGAHGLSTASMTWFGKPVSDLSIGEGAFLAGLPQRPARSVAEALVRRRAVLEAMRRTGRLSAAQMEAADALVLNVQPNPSARFLAAHLSASLVAGRPDPADLSLRDAPVDRHWREIRTTLDADLQMKVEALLRGHLGGLQDRFIGQAAVVAVDNRSGAVLAYVGSADPGDLRTEGANDGVRMRRQPGSALKPFTYGAAIEARRLTAATVLADVETPFVEAGAAFTARNYDRTYHGPVPARTALASSFNVPALRVAQRLGVHRLLDRLHAAGFASLNQPAEFYGIGLTLGNGEVRLLELVQAYAGLARGGTLPDLHAVAFRVSVAGDTLFRAPGPVRPRFMTPQVAWIITDILSDPEARSPAFGRGGPLELPFPAAAKTGTSRDYRDNWAIGYTPRHTVAVWAGNFDGTPMQVVGGVAGAGPLMNAVLRELGGSGVFKPVAGVQVVTVCPESGKRPGTWCPAPRSEWFLDDFGPEDVCDVHDRREIDTRSGQLADGSTPQSARAVRTFANYPAEFHPWMVEHAMPIAPASAVAPDARPAIQYPVDGMVFQMDPVLRASFQQIRLQAAIPPGLVGHAWVVDGTALDVPFVDAVWPLQPGRHRLVVQAHDASGRVFDGDPIDIRVLPIDRSRP